MRLRRILFLRRAFPLRYEILLGMLLTLSFYLASWAAPATWGTGLIICWTVSLALVTYYVDFVSGVIALVLILASGFAISMKILTSYEVIITLFIISALYPVREVVFRGGVKADLVIGALHSLLPEGSEKSGWITYEYEVDEEDIRRALAGAYGNVIILRIRRRVGDGLAHPLRVKAVRASDYVGHKIVTPVPEELHIPLYGSALHAALETLRGNVFGSVYAAPERFEAQYGVTLTGSGTTITLTKTSGETFTMPGTITITTITNVTMMQGLPQWDADIYVVVALKPDEYRGREYMFFSSSEYKAPDWAILPDLAKSGRTVTLIPKYVGCRIYHYNTNVKKYLVGFWEGIENIYPRPVWAAGERVGISGGCSDYYFPTYADGTYICAAYSDTNVCWKERFYARVTVPAGDVTIKAPSQIVFSEYKTTYQDNPHKLDTSYYYKTFFKLQYYIFYDALNMSNVLLSGSSAQATLRVDRPIKGAFVYVYSKTEVKMPPPPPPPSVSVWLPNICWSDDPELTVASIKGDEKTRTVTVDFGSCSTCDAYVVPGPGTYDVSQVTKCSKSGNTASCKVPEGYTVILDGNPNE